MSAAANSTQTIPRIGVRDFVTAFRGMVREHGAAAYLLSSLVIALSLAMLYDSRLPHPRFAPRDPAIRNVVGYASTVVLSLLGGWADGAISVRSVRGESIADSMRVASVRVFDLVLARIIVGTVSAIGCALAFVPGLVVMVFVAPVSTLICVEWQSAFGALRESVRLVRRAFLPVLVTFASLLGLAMFAASCVSCGAAIVDTSGADEASTFRLALRMAYAAASPLIGLIGPTLYSLVRRAEAVDASRVAEVFS